MILEAVEPISVSPVRAPVLSELRFLLRSATGELAADALCGVVYDLLDRVDPAFAERLHLPLGLKPVTAGALAHSLPGVYHLRLTALDTAAEAALSSLRGELAAVGEPGLTLGLHRAYVQPTARGLVTALLPAAELERFDTDFVSPTMLKRNGRYLPLPLPEELAANWLRRWNRFSGAPCSEEVVTPFLDWVARNVDVSQHRLHTVTLPLRSGVITGFVGKVRFTLAAAEARNAPEATHWHRLWQYSYWCGTGVKTLWGCGQTRPALSVVSREVK
ncbi:MAG: CRISPR system precrRNA processing endoribonuclease RAMP protein Cas6 [Actinomycetota bacterium]